MSNSSSDTLQQAQTKPVSLPVSRLQLRDLSFERVEFELAENVLDPRHSPSRSVVVRVASGCSWRDAVRFPSMLSEASATTGDDKLDAAICDRAAEELTRLEAAVLALEARAA